MKKVILTTLLVALLGTAPIEVVSTSDQQSVGTIEQRVRDLDFKNDADEAKKWAESSYEKWEKDLTKAQQKSFYSLNNPFFSPSLTYDINQTLKMFGGDLTKRPIDDEAFTKLYLKDTEQIERALNGKEGKLKNTLYVYKNDSLKNLALINDRLFVDNENPNVLNQDKVSELADKLSRATTNEFFICDLTDKPAKENETIQWKIKVPKGTASGYTENKLILDRNLGLEVTNTKIITDKGKERIQIEAEIVPKEQIDEKNKDLNESLNAKLNEVYRLPDNSRFVETRFMGLAGVVISEQIHDLLNQVDDQIDKEVLKVTMKFMLEKNGKLIITDSSLVASPESYEPDPQTKETLDECFTSKGIYNENNRTITIDTRYLFPNGALLESDTLIHEIGHAVDYCAGEKKFPGKLVSITETTLFSAIYEREKNTLTEYATENEHEFFAEAFRMMHSKDPADAKQVRDKAPETYKFINDILKYITQ